MTDSARFCVWPHLGLRALCLALLFALLWAAPAQANHIGPLLEQRLDVDASQAQSEQARKELLALRQFYEGRGFAPAWVGESGIDAPGRTLADVLTTVDLDGLQPVNYEADKIKALADSTDPADMAELEFTLSRSLVHYGRDLSAGRVEPNEVDSELYIYPDPVQSLNLISSAASATDLAGYLASLAPQTDEYARLKQALADYRAIAAAGGWSRLPEGETLKPGMRDPQVASLQKRLVEAGDLEAPGADPDLFDPKLEAAVKHFQYRHGLDIDGAVGKMTRAALNVPVEQRIEQMLLNMERRRWMPDDLGQRYVFVNLADFYLKVVDEPKTIFDSRVVIGKTYHRTPVFSNEMTYLEINPYWNVPPSIARKEILPKVRKDVAYLAENNMKVLSDWGANATPLDPAKINWATMSASNFSYKFRQDPGPENALGRVKFMFPNQFNVYLHDTPSRSLFQRAVRSFSHGCIRVEKPLELAGVVLGLEGPAGWDQAAVQGAVDSRERQIVRLERPLPVHITYLTAWVNKDGSVHFRDDIYGRDGHLAAALRRSNATGRIDG